jgi:hypothetical protein
MLVAAVAVLVPLTLAAPALATESGKQCTLVTGPSGTHTVWICAANEFVNQSWARAQVESAGDPMPYDIVLTSHQFSRPLSGGSWDSEDLTTVEGFYGDGAHIDTNHQSDTQIQCRVKAETSGTIYFTQNQYQSGNGTGIPTETSLFSSIYPYCTS